MRKELEEYSRTSKNLFFASILLLLILVLGLLYYLIFFSRGILHFKISDYLLSENLVFYTSHLFKRALWGTIVVKGLAVKNYQSFLMGTYFMILAISIFYFIRINKNELLAIFFLTSPLGILFYLADTRSFARKEMLFFPLLLGVTQFIISKSHQTLKLLGVMISSVIMILIHDSFIFLAMPLLIYFLYKEGFSFKLLILYVASCFCFTIVVGKIAISEIDHDILTNFFNSLGVNWSETQYALMVDVRTTFTESSHHFMKYNFLVFFFLYLIHLTVLKYFFDKTFSDNKIFFFMQAIFLISLSLIARDYGRWVAFACFNSVLVISAYNSKELLPSPIKYGLLKMILIGFFFLFLRSPHWSNYNLLDKGLYLEFLNPAWQYLFHRFFLVPA
jgi:hypothetical protein